MSIFSVTYHCVIFHYIYFKPCEIYWFLNRMGSFVFPMCCSELERDPDIVLLVTLLTNNRVLQLCRFAVFLCHAELQDIYQANYVLGMIENGHATLMFSFWVKSPQLLGMPVLCWTRSEGNLPLCTSSFQLALFSLQKRKSWTLRWTRNTDNVKSVDTKKERR